MTVDDLITLSEDFGAEGIPDQQCTVDPVDKSCVQVNTVSRVMSIKILPKSRGRFTLGSETF